MGACSAKSPSVVPEKIPTQLIPGEKKRDNLNKSGTGTTRTNKSGGDMSVSKASLNDKNKSKFRQKHESFFDVKIEQEFEKYSPRIVNEKEIDFIVEKLLKIEFFGGSSIEDLKSVASYMDIKKFESGITIIKSGSYNDIFYLFKSGKFIKVTYNGQNEEKEEIGDFGSINLCFGSEVDFSIICNESGTAYIINRVTYQRTMMDLSRAQERKNVDFIGIFILIDILDNIPILAPLTKDQRIAVANALQHKTYKDGDVIIHQGDIGDAFYIIEEGMVVIQEHRNLTGKKSTTEDLVVHLVDRKVGDYFGERALIKDEPRNADVVAKGPVKCLVLLRTEFNELLGGLVQLLDQNNIVRILQAIIIFKPLTEQKLFQLASNLYQCTYQPGQYIITQGSPGEHFYIIKEGKVQVTMTDNENNVKIIGELIAGEYFGEGALLTNEVRRASVRAIEKVVVLALDRHSFNNSLGTLKDELLASFSERKNQPKVKMNQLQKIRILGVGSYGTVILVRHTNTGMTYALKQMLKATIVLSDHQQFVLNELLLLKKLHHQFMVNLVSTFTDNDSVYMLTELCLGGELYTYMRDTVNNKSINENDEIPGCFDTSTSQFYTANIILGLEYIHGLGFCHRDLKPENLLFTNEGYIKIADFGFAKEVKDGRTYSLCGTPEYTAPEVYKRSGHNTSVDYWALGVILYEMSSGFSPFHVHSQNPWDCFLEINRYTSAFPHVQFPSCFSADLQNLLLQLLNPNPFRRIGSKKGGITDLKNHDFYRSFSWIKLAEQTLKTPYKPSIKSLLDTSQFSDTIEPLKAPDDFDASKHDMAWANEF